MTQYERQQDLESKSGWLGRFTMAEKEWWRRGAIAFLLAGLLFTAASVISFVIGRPWSFLDAQMTIALVFVLGGVVSLYAIQRPTFGLLGRASSVVTGVGLIVAIIGTAAVVVAPEFGWLAFVGLPLTWIGCLALGIATVRAHVLPRWTGVALAIGFPAAAVAGFTFAQVLGTPLTDSGAFRGAIVPGIIWLAIAYVLRTQEPRAGVQ